MLKIAYFVIIGSHSVKLTVSKKENWWIDMYSTCISKVIIKVYYSMWGCEVYNNLGPYDTHVLLYLKSVYILVHVYTCDRL